MSPYPTQPTLELRLHHQQGIAFQTDATEVLYGGAASGGKSHLMRVASIIWSLAIPGLQTYLFRRTVGDLYKNHFEGPTSYPNLLATLVQSKYCRIVKNEVRFANGSKIFLQHCQHERDVDNYRGYEFHVLLIDELTLFTGPMYRFLRARLRMTDDFKARIPEALRGQFPRILAGSNPGGPGHHFVKGNWVDHGEYVKHRALEDPDDIEEGDDPQPEGLVRQFIPAKVRDNPSVNARQYKATLRGLEDPLLIRAMLDGDWSIVAGSMFGDVWKVGRHICLDFPIPADWKIWRGADDGYAAAHCTLWGTEDPNTGTIYVINEIYEAGMLPATVAARVAQLDRSTSRMDEWGREYAHGEGMEGILDSAAFNDNGLDVIKGAPTRKEQSRGDSMNALGMRWTRCRKWPRCRQHGWQDVHAKLAPNKKDPDGMPGLRFFRRCVNIIRTLPAVLRDKKDPEDIDDPDDHALDALRYLLQRRQPFTGEHRVS